jgi:ribonuclease HI
VTKIIYTDGSGTSRGTSAYCIVLKNWYVENPEAYNFKTHKSKGQDKIFKIIPCEMNVYEIEYLALIEAIKLIPISLFGNENNYTLYMDNQQIVKELNENFSKHPHHMEMINKVHHLIEIKRCKITILWIPREKNLAGICLEKRLERVNKYLRQISRVPNRAKYKL